VIADDPRHLLAQPHLTVLTRHADYELRRIHEVIAQKALVDGRADLEELFGKLLAVPGPVTAKTLDLVGHSTPGKSLLSLGDWVLDSANPVVTAFFRELADHEVLPRLGVFAMRLLGCETARTDDGRATICALADLLGVEVYGTRSLIYSAHYDAHGFKREWGAALVGSADLRRESSGVEEPVYDPHPRTLDLDTLPTKTIVPRCQAWPVRVVTPDVVPSFLRLVRRTAGAQMPGLLAAPSCELALPASRPGHYHIAQIVLDGEFIRVYPDGEELPGIVYPVHDAHELRRLADALPAIG
jgi:hypothetical protein